MSEKCDIIENIDCIFIIHGDIKFTSKASIYFNKIMYFSKNKALFILYLPYLAFYMNGTVNMFENHIQHNNYYGIGV